MNIDFTCSSAFSCVWKMPIHPLVSIRCSSLWDLFIRYFCCCYFYFVMFSRQAVTSTFVFTLRHSTKTGPCTCKAKWMCLLGIYTILVKWWDDTRIFTPLKKLSHKVIQLISLFFVNTTNDFSIFWYVVKKLASFFTHLLCFQISPCKRETNEHQMNRRLASHRIVKYQAVVVVFQAWFSFLVLIHPW